MATKRVLTRREAEQLIGDYQKEMLRRYECFSTWELYADFGASHCCGGIYRLRDEELRQVYAGLIAGIEEMEREEMLAAIVHFERAQVGGEGLITCQDVAQHGRVCDGLDRYTNTELAVWFRDALGDTEVVDDPVPEDALSPRRSFLYLAFGLAVGLLVVIFLLAFLGQ